jgi:ribonuclease HI
MKKLVIIYTDGACSGNPGPGGWGVVLKYNNHIKQLFGGEPFTTNNRMELLAAIKALEGLKIRCQISLFTDSKYLKQGITEWLEKWKKNSWRTASKQLIKNIDLWQRLDFLSQQHEIEWNWVKAHNGDYYNELADQLAVKGCQLSKTSSKVENDVDRN